MTTITTLNEFDDRLIDMKYISGYTGMTDKWFYALIKQGKFPKPIKLGRTSRWKMSELINWLNKQEEASSR
ncbi:AlpA family phage regulatory protein [Orbus wheelerorum]|uniref:helix-turn-helix transcriptional regulator n=1 Tax=Orbus wheelerorum TaxID=3074111 RepID=UPI00370D9E09